MSESRGRALILSNSYNNTRLGSEHDHANIREMLEKFGFITTGRHGNFTAQVSIGILTYWYGATPPPQAHPVSVMICTILLI